MKDCAPKTAPPDPLHPAAPGLSRAHPLPEMSLPFGENR